MSKPIAREQTIERLSDLKPFIAYLEKTKDEEWQIDTVRNSSNSKNCVMGHLVNWFYGERYEGDISLAWDLFEEIWATTYMIYPVNDGHAPSWMNYKYDQSTPKERIIAYLKNLNGRKEKTVQDLWEEGERRLNVELEKEKEDNQAN